MFMKTMMMCYTVSRKQEHMYRLAQFQVSESPSKDAITQSN